jgi:hypothetical protein
MADGELRASDSDRERAAEAIRVHYAAGRLTDEELDERLKAVYSARTSKDLRALSVDLPVLPPTLLEQRAELSKRRSHLQRRVLQQAGGGLGIFGLCTAIWVSNGASGQFWPIFVLIAVLIPLARSAWALYGPAPELDRVEAELERASRQRRPS